MTGPVRHFEAAVSAGAMALAWARTEDGPAGARVVVDHEVSPRGRNGRVWPVPADATLAVAVVVRPTLTVEDADAVWLVAGVVGAVAVSAVTGRSMTTWWPDRVVDRDEIERVMTKAEIQLGPGGVRAAVMTLRFDLAGLGLGPAGREPLLEAVGEAVDELGASVDPDLLSQRYGESCALLGRAVKLTLLPAGQTRGRASAVDRGARLHLTSSTGMVERIGVGQLRDLRVADELRSGGPG